MLRPLGLDILWVLFSLGLGAVAFVVGRWSCRRPWARCSVIALAAALGVVIPASMLLILPSAIYAAALEIGGAAVILGWMGLLLLGILWGWMPAATWKSRLVLYLAAGLGGILLLQSGACLWWRFCDPDLWERTADARGGAMQSTGWTCYPATGVMLLHHYGITASEGEMAYLANTSLWGTEDHALARALTARARAGWHAEVEVADYETCVRRGGPFIAAVTPPRIGPHGIFVKKALPEYLEVIDPLDGVARKTSRADFERVWTGRLVRFVSAPR